MIVISEKTFAALSESAENRGVEVCQKCPVKEESKGIKVLYLGPNGERGIFYR
jgi:hypothetical protein